MILILIPAELVNDVLRLVLVEDVTATVEFVADAVAVRSAAAQAAVRGRRGGERRVVDAGRPGYGGWKYPSLLALQIRLSFTTLDIHWIFIGLVNGSARYWFNIPSTKR